MSQTHWVWVLVIFFDNPSVLVFLDHVVLHQVQRCYPGVAANVAHQVRHLDGLLVSVLNQDHHMQVAGDHVRDRSGSIPTSCACQFKINR